MNDYRPPAADAGYLLLDVLGAGGRLAALGAFAEVDEALIVQVLEEAGKFVGEVVAIGVEASVEGVHAASSAARAMITSPNLST